MACPDLQRLIQAQGDGDRGVFAQALRELQAGRKQGHWIWFLLPQPRGLGRSAMAERYGFADLAEARAYLADPLLSQRLEQVLTVITQQLQQSGASLETLMGGHLDAAKTISSLTLFEAAVLSSVRKLLDRINRRCFLTQTRLDCSCVLS